MKNCALGLIFGFLANSALSATESGTQLQWSVNSGLGYTNNATLVDTDPISETVGGVGGTIDLVREGSRLNATLRGAGNYLSYFDNTYSNELLGSAAAAIRFGLVGDALIWSLDNTFGQSTTNEFEPSTPDNRGNVNVVSTGPDLRVRLGGPNELVMRGRYDNSSYQDSSETDSHSWTGEAGVVHRVSPAVAWSLNGTASRVNYDTAGNPGYTQNEVFVRLESRRAGQELTADLGAGFLDDGNQTEQKPVVRLNWSRRLTPSWGFGLNVASGFQNSGQQFATGVADGTELGGTQDVILTNQVHEYDTAELSLNFERPRTTLSLTTGVDRERYPASSDLNRDSWSVGTEASRRLTPRLRALLDVTYENRNFQGDSEDDNTTTFSLGIDWRLGKALFLGLKGGTQRRSGNTDYTYDETVYQATVAYRPFAP